MLPKKKTSGQAAFGLYKFNKDQHEACEESKVEVKPRSRHDGFIPKFGGTNWSITDAIHANGMEESKGQNPMQSSFGNYSMFGSSQKQ